MKRFRELTIQLEQKCMNRFVQLLCSDFNSLWSRDLDREKEIEYMGDTTTYCFKRAADESLPAAALSIYPISDSSWRVPNVVPQEFGKLSYDEYNGVLAEFYRLYVEPVARLEGVLAQLTSDEVSDSEILGGENAARHLRIFSSTANKSTGNTHPSDRARWFDFIVAACKVDDPIDIEQLLRLLCEQGWDEESASKLANQFEYSQDLIHHIRK